MMLQLEKKVLVSPEEKESFFSELTWLTYAGDYNHCPGPIQEKDVNWYICQKKQRIHRFSEHRQLLDVPEQVWANTVEILWYTDCGMMVVYPDKWHPEHGNIVYDEDSRYFRIGCEHSYEELSPGECKEAGIDHFGMCWHVFRCTQCSYTMSQDSSG